MMMMMRRFYRHASSSTLLVQLLLVVVVVVVAMVAQRQRPSFIIGIGSIEAFLIQPPPLPSLSSYRTTHDYISYDPNKVLHSVGTVSRGTSTWNRVISSSSSALSSTNNSNRNSNNEEQRRKVLLSRTGPHFQVDRRKGTIEFGATANLVTQLPPPSTPPILQQQQVLQNEGDATAATTITTTTSTTTSSTSSMIDLWLLDENRGLAMSIWDPKLMKDLGNHIYRLQIMTLQFVTITLAPWVDVQMVTTLNNNNNNNNNNPTPEFIVQSIGFDPNIQILPGMRINGNALGIVIEVAGVLRPGSDGTSVTGAIAFQTSGNLPPPLRILPDGILKAASDTINTTIVNFAIQSFQKGAKMNYLQFVQQYEKKQKESELANGKS